MTVPRSQAEASRRVVPLGFATTVPLPGGGAGELDASSPAADDDPSRYTDVVQGDVGRAIGQDQVPVNRQVVQGDGVPPDNHIARHHPGPAGPLWST